MITKDVSISFRVLLGLVVIGFVLFIGSVKADPGEREQAVA